MDERKELILKIIIQKYIDTAQPVSSSCLVREYDLGVSSATVRNEMAALEKANLIIQPHTSAGRVPTAEAYEWYGTQLASGKLSADEKKKLKKVKGDWRSEQDLKQLAKLMAEISDLAVFWGFHRHNLYYTGISNLFKQPEFEKSQLLYDISGIIDRLDEIVNDYYDEFAYEPEILTGRESPFGDFSGTVVAKYKIGDNRGVVGILGPMRMDYEKALGLIETVSDIIKEK